MLRVIKKTLYPYKHRQHEHIRRSNLKFQQKFIYTHESYFLDRRGTKQHAHLCLHICMSSITVIWPIKDNIFTAITWLYCLHCHLEYYVLHSTVCCSRSSRIAFEIHVPFYNSLQWDCRHSDILYWSDTECLNTLVTPLLVFNWILCTVWSKEFSIQASWRQRLTLTETTFVPKVQ